MAAPRIHKLPVQQLTVLSIARFAEPIAMTSVFPYLPEMIESLNVAPDEVAKWAGFAASVFSLSQAVFAVPWGRASDKYGRKPAILTCLTGTMIFTIFWGFSRSLGMAIAVRAAQGIFNGNVGIIRTTVAEMVPWKELQPRAFSVMPLVWNVGSIFGPALGGALANPMRRVPGEPLPENPGLLDLYPYLLPNLVAAALFAVGITTGILFLEESLETAKGRRDWGRELGKRLTLSSQRLWQRIKNFNTSTDPSRQPLLKPPRPSRDIETPPYLERKKPIEPPPSISECLTRQSILNLIAYTLLATHNIAFDGLIPIFMHYPRHTHPQSSPLRFAGGFGLDSARIGILFTLYGVSGMIIQFFIFPPCARIYGVARCLRVCSVAMPVVYFFVPFTALIQDQETQMVVGFMLMLTKGFFSTFAFPCSTILLTNSAPSLRILGTLNGIAVSVSAIGRAAGPAITGAVFSVGVERGYVVAPWWTLTVIAVLASVPVWWVVEGEGFGGDEGEIEDDEEESEVEEGDDEAQTPTGTGTVRVNRGGMLRTALDTGADLEDVEGQRGYGVAGGMLSRTTTIDSDAIEEEEEGEYEGSPRIGGPRSAPVSRRGSRAVTPRRVSRKISIPIGMSGMSRRYSSNLGHSLGSAAGN
ncbi:major facilitator superfamily domain-containing protein [Elsinoe ampelina]|uniref:Major facilitator superfamily domain-containing protein n=1 Tax=Elsinoe ampelina TaxID=302913 RepID=A0A6A6GGL0_9PEZI|nr:major facilitator superfamily domain-containing protein [Elsinoe ampelina]